VLLARNWEGHKQRARCSESNLRDRYVRLRSTAAVAGRGLKGPLMFTV
jgi:hypothetical protein